MQQLQSGDDRGSQRNVQYSIKYMPSPVTVPISSLQQGPAAQVSWQGNQVGPFPSQWKADGICSPSTMDVDVASDSSMISLMGDLTRMELKLHLQYF